MGKNGCSRGRGKEQGIWVKGKGCMEGEARSECPKGEGARNKGLEGKEEEEGGYRRGTRRIGRLEGE